MERLIKLSKTSLTGIRPHFFAINCAGIYCMRKNLFLFFCTLLCCTFSFAQLKPVYTFQQDDTTLKRKLYEAALADKKALIVSLGKEYKKDYTDIYEERFKSVGALLKSSRAVTSPEAYNYLQALTKKIIDANDELKQLNPRILFTRDDWPNAYSMGEGTLVVNAGLMVYLDNEAELVFVLCHELSHFYIDHSNKAIRKNVELVNSEEFKKEVKRISKEEYRVNQQIETLIKKLSFGGRRHSRDNETEADRQAWLFMKKTGYDCNGIKTCLQLLDKVDDSLLYKPLEVSKVLNFDDYPFKKKWIEKESVLFGAMSGDESPLTKAEKDSLKTHPDCSKRILALEDSIKKCEGNKKFLVDENLFRQLKKDFFAEMIEQDYKDDDLGLNLYFNLVLLQEQENLPLAIYSVARDLNRMYESQKNHTLGTLISAESRTRAADYNLLLRMIKRLKLEEIAALSYQFCNKYKDYMTGYTGFEEERNKAFKNYKPE